MAIDVGDLVENLTAEVNPPGTDLFPNATASQWELRLANAFWELVIAGLITGYTEEDGIITEDVATPANDLGRDYQQLMVLAAAINVITMEMVNINTAFRAQAGPVEYEVQKSAAVLAAVLDRLEKRFNRIIADLPDANVPATDFYFDPFCLRSDSSVYPASTFIGY